MTCSGTLREREREKKKDDFLLIKFKTVNIIFGSLKEPWPDIGCESVLQLPHRIQCQEHYFFINLQKVKNKSLLLPQAEKLPRTFMTLKWD